MSRWTSLVMVFAGVLASSNAARSFTIEEIQAVKDVVIELCRGGHKRRTAQNYQIQAEGKLTAVVIKKLVEAGLEGKVVLDEKEWEGFEALANADRYGDCVDKHLPRFLDGLSQATGMLDLRSNPSNMQVWFDGDLDIKLPSQTPFQAALPPGTYTVVLTKLDAEYSGWGYRATDTIVVKKGTTVIRELSGEHVELARLTINPLDSQAHYYLDERHALGRLQEPIVVEVFPGQHTLFKESNGHVATRIFSIGAGLAKTVSF